MKVNDLIFKELLKRGYRLEGKTRVWDVADSKLWYLQPEQAQGFLDLESAPDYKKSVTDKEVKLIEDNLSEILKALPHKEYNIVDLGCGDGMKAALFIKDLPADIKVRYCPVDISGFMVKKAIKNIQSLKNVPVIEFNWNISDFDNLPNLTSVLSSGYYKHNFLLILGDTFCNFDSDDILSSIKASMKKDDFVLFGNNLLLGNVGKNVEPYKNSYVDKFLSKIIEQLGLSRNDVTYGVRFHSGKIETYYDVKRNKIIKHSNKNVHFQAGDRIIVAYSYRYLFDELKEKIEKYFKNTQYFVSAEKDYALILSKYQ